MKFLIQIKGREEWHEIRPSHMYTCNPKKPEWRCYRFKVDEIRFLCAINGDRLRVRSPGIKPIEIKYDKHGSVPEIIAEEEVIHYERPLSSFRKKAASNLMDGILKKGWGLPK